MKNLPLTQISLFSIFIFGLLFSLITCTKSPSEQINYGEQHCAKYDLSFIDKTENGYVCKNPESGTFWEYHAWDGSWTQYKLN